MIDTSPSSFNSKPFPTGVLPGPMERFIRQSARVIGCDQAQVALPLLSALASCVGNARRVRLNSTWTEPCVIWTVVVGESGTKKSPPMRLAVKPLHDTQNDAMLEYEEMMTLHEQELAEHDAAYSQWKSKGRQRGEAAPVKPNPPTPRRFIISDTTIEAVAIRLKENPRGLLLYTDELAGWLGGFDQYRGGRGADSAKWIELFHGNPLLVDRKSKGQVIHVPMASVSVCGSIQPGVLRRHLGVEHFEDGMAARLLLHMTPRRVHRWNRNELSNDAVQEMARLFQTLRALPFDDGPGGQLRPVDVPLSDKGADAWEGFYNRHNKLLAGMVGREAAAFTKLECYTARLALLIHLIREAMGEVNNGAIDEQSVACAEQLTLWFGEEVHRVYGVLDESQEQQQVRQIVELIRARDGSISARDFQRTSRRFRDDPKAALEELQALEGLRFGQLEYPSPGSTGGKPSAVFRLHPSYLDANTPVFDSASGGNGVGCELETEN